MDFFLNPLQKYWKSNNTNLTLFPDNNTTTKKKNLKTNDL